MIFRFRADRHEAMPGDGRSPFVGQDGPFYTVTLLVGNDPKKLRATGTLLLSAGEWARFRFAVEDFEIDEVHLLGPEMRRYCYDEAEPPSDASRLAMTRALDEVTCPTCLARVKAYLDLGNAIHVFGWRGATKSGEPMVVVGSPAATPWGKTLCGLSTKDVLSVPYPELATCETCRAGGPKAP